jgi:hypothetical protein
MKKTKSLYHGHRFITVIAFPPQSSAAPYAGIFGSSSAFATSKSYYSSAV